MSMEVKEFEIRVIKIIPRTRDVKSFRFAVSEDTNFKPGQFDKTAWKGKTGFINSEMIKEEIPDYDERIFYICGPPEMVKYLRSLLTDELKFDKEKIKVENFAGYL